jgi:TRAP-type C4-dicarboxylate transport system permease small subunit
MLKAYEGLTRIFRAAGALCVIALIAILLASIVLREVFGLPLVWANEVSIALFVWAVFLGAGVATAENAHIRFDIAVTPLPRAMRRSVGLLVSYGGLVLLVGFWVTSIYVAYLYRGQSFTTIAASAAWQWSAVPVGTTLAILGWLRHAKWTWRGADLSEKPMTEIPGV